MKKILLSCFSIILLTSCSNNDENLSENPTENKIGAKTISDLPTISENPNESEGLMFYDDLINVLPLIYDKDGNLKPDHITLTDSFLANRYPDSSVILGKTFEERLIEFNKLSPEEQGIDSNVKTHLNIIVSQVKELSNYQTLSNDIIIEKFKIIEKKISEDISIKEDDKDALLLFSSIKRYELFIANKYFEKTTPAMNTNNQYTTYGDDDSFARAVLILWDIRRESKPKKKKGRHVSGVQYVKIDGRYRKVAS